MFCIYIGGWRCRGNLVRVFVLRRKIAEDSICGKELHAVHKIRSVSRLNFFVISIMRAKILEDIPILWREVRYSPESANIESSLLTQFLIRDSFMDTTSTRSTTNASSGEIALQTTLRETLTDFDIPAGWRRLLKERRDEKGERFCCREGASEERASKSFIGESLNVENCEKRD